MTAKETATCLAVSSWEDYNEYDVEVVKLEDVQQDFDFQEEKPNIINLSNLTINRREGRQQPSYLIKAEESNNGNFGRKRKHSGGLTLTVDANSSCEFLSCPHNDIRYGFRDRVTSDNHQLICPSRTGLVSSFELDVQVKPPVLPLVSSSFGQLNAAATVNSVQTFIDLTGSGVSEEGKETVAGAK